MTIYIYWFRVIYILKLHSYLAIWSFYFVLCILNRLLGLFCSVKEHPLTKVPSLSNLFNPIATLRSTSCGWEVPKYVHERGKKYHVGSIFVSIEFDVPKNDDDMHYFPNSVFRIHILNSLNVGFAWSPGNEIIPIRNYMLILELGKWFILCIID